MSQNNVPETSLASGVFHESLRPLTIGILLGVTIVAFEGLAVVTIAPQFASSLGGMALYGWVFSAYLLASLLGIVVGGQLADTRGPGLPFRAGLFMFILGLLVSGFAPSMGVLIVGRFLQGFGGGSFVTAQYVAVNLAYEDALRPRMMAFMSSAWVVPALLGPAVAGFIAEWLNWRVVFWGMVPLLLLVMVLTHHAFTQLDKPEAQAAQKGNKTRLLSALGLVIGTAVFLTALGQLNMWTALIALAAGMLMIYSLRMIVPAGTLRLQTGLPAVLATKGLLYAGFMGVQAFIAVMLTSVHAYSSSVTGVAIATGAISWTAGSWTQERLDSRFDGQGRSLRVLLGALLIVLGLSLQFVALLSSFVPLLMTIAGWLCAGFGMGVSHATSSVLAFAFAPEGEEGMVASALQIADTFMSALSTGAGGALFAFAMAAQYPETQGVLLAFLLSVGLAVLGCVAAYRIEPQVVLRQARSVKSS